MEFLDDKFVIFDQNKKKTKTKTKQKQKQKKQTNKHGAFKWGVS